MTKVFESTVILPLPKEYSRVVNACKDMIGVLSQTVFVLSLRLLGGEQLLVAVAELVQRLVTFVL